MWSRAKGLSRKALNFSKEKSREKNLRKIPQKNMANTLVKELI
jgi:hypothetical protein